MRIYDLISVSEEMTEQLFLSSFQPKLVESNQCMEDIEVLTSQMIARCQDARDQAAKAEDERTRERGRDPGGGNGLPWHIKKQFKPSKQLDLNFTVTELRAWNRQWDQYFEVSNLNNAEFSIQRSIFLQCLSKEMISRLDSEFEGSVSMRALIKEEFARRNPQMVMGHAWL